MALVSLALAVAACGRDDSLQWTEDVLLPDGRTITLTRYQEFKGNHEICDSPSVSKYWFEFTHPDVGESVRWEHERTHTTVYLMVHERVAYLLVMLNFGGDTKFHCPSPPFLLYALFGHRWAQQPLEFTARGHVSQHGVTSCLLPHYLYLSLPIALCSAQNIADRHLASLARHKCLKHRTSA